MIKDRVLHIDMQSPRGYESQRAAGQRAMTGEELKSEFHRQLLGAMNVGHLGGLGQQGAPMTEEQSQDLRDWQDKRDLMEAFDAMPRRWWTKNGAWL